ncbi:hypothetical protein IFT75_01905 [Pseudomonas sp. CFBP 8758]|uniref:Uncharacterized protein n=1 Tax=Pseudomonas baltica TaxID=2762576 RepID=A0A7X1G718_9PSED|nr:MULTISPECIES: hypothetical protein [Pseudomonas]MBC2678879.1 hypothetical protein [Pseudomonas baltica]MBD8592156.1 hypothetical protein [Pseudomonas sp. CFBP 8758]
MTEQPKSVDSIAVPLLKQDTRAGVSGYTLDLLSKLTGLSRTGVIHLALRQMADRYLHKYDMDDGPLSDAQHTAILLASRATSIPADHFTKRLF